MFFLGVSCSSQPDRLTVIEDQHLNQTGQVAVLPDRRRLGRGVDPGIKPERHGGSFHFGTLSVLRSMGVAKDFAPPNVLRFAVRQMGLQVRLAVGSLRSACCDEPMNKLPK